MIPYSTKFRIHGRGKVSASDTVCSACHDALENAPCQVNMGPYSERCGICCLVSCSKGPLQVLRCDIVTPFHSTAVVSGTHPLEFKAHNPKHHQHIAPGQFAKITLFDLLLSVPFATTIVTDGHGPTDRNHAGTMPNQYDCATRSASIHRAVNPSLQPTSVWVSSRSVEHQSSLPRAHRVHAVVCRALATLEL